MVVEVEGVQFEVKGSRWRLREWRRRRLRGCSLRLWGCSGG